MRYIIFILIILIAGYAQADSVGIEVTPSGIAFPLGIDAENTLAWDSVHGAIKDDTGIDFHDTGVNSCKITVNVGDDTKVDHDECNIHLGGPQYTFAAATSLPPNFGTGENSVYIGMTMNGYTTSTIRWTSTQELTVIPLARLNTELGDTGAGSSVHLIRDDRYFISNRDYYDMVLHKEAFGALYVTGGKIFSHATSLVLQQTAGVLFDAQSKRHELAAFANMSAIFLHLSSTGGDDWLGAKQPLIVDNVYYNPSGSGLVALLNSNKFKVDTIIKSPKGPDGTPEGGWFYVFGDTEYDTQADAIAAVNDDSATRFGVFKNQAESGLVVIALIVQQKDATIIDTIEDRRPCLVCRP